LGTANLSAVTFVDESCEASQKEESPSREGTHPSDQILTRKSSPKKRFEVKRAGPSTDSVEVDSTLRTTHATSSSDSDSAVDLFIATDLPSDTNTEHANSQPSPYHSVITAELLHELPSRKDVPDGIHHSHESNLSPGHVFERPQTLDAFSPSGFSTSPIEQSSNTLGHQDVEDQEIAIQPSPSNSTFTAPAIPMTKEEAFLFRHYLENLAPWVRQTLACSFCCHCLTALCTVRYLRHAAAFPTRGANTRSVVDYAFVRDLCTSVKTFGQHLRLQ
jgi:hypothetical protein